MGVNRPTIPILGIIIAISALVLGAFTWVSVSRMEGQVTNLTDKNLWYRFNQTTFYGNPTFTYLTFDGLVIEFEIAAGESVSFSFTSRTHIEAVTGAWSYITLYFRLDGYLSTHPNAQVGMYSGTFTQHEMIHLQDVRDNLSPGTHNVTIDIYSSSTANYILESSLIVQKVHT